MRRSVAVSLEKRRTSKMLLAKTRVLGMTSSQALVVGFFLQATQMPMLG